MLVLKALTIMVSLPRMKVNHIIIFLLHFKVIVSLFLSVTAWIFDQPCHGEEKRAITHLGEGAS